MNISDGLLYTKYKNKDDMMKRINDKNKYPLIRQLSEGKTDIQNLSCLFLPEYCVVFFFLEQLCF